MGQETPPDFPQDGPRPLPLNQAAELQRVSGGQHAQHVVQGHVHLARVEVLQGCGEGWGGSIRERAVGVGFSTVPMPDGPVSTSWVARDALRERAPAPTWVQALPGPLPPRGIEGAATEAGLPLRGCF